MNLASERRLERINRAVASGRIVPYLAGVTLIVVFAAALVVNVFARGEFETFGESIWWAAQTITTVGYGDVIPQTAFSKAVAVVVMLFGIATVSLMTAVVTSAVMTLSQRKLNADADTESEDLRATLGRIEQRLEALEQRLR